MKLLHCCRIQVIAQCATSHTFGDISISGRNHFILIHACVVYLFLSFNWTLSLIIKVDDDDDEICPRSIELYCIITYSFVQYLILIGQLGHSMCIADRCYE